jgi:predicted metal-binding membrane protein
MRAQQAPHLRNTPSLVAKSALAALLLAWSGAAWLLTAQLTSVDMRMGLLTSPLAMSSMDQMTDQMSAMGMPPLGSFVGMWAVMIAAMMLPSLWPAARAVDATNASCNGRSL